MKKKSTLVRSARTGKLPVKKAGKSGVRAPHKNSARPSSGRGHWVSENEFLRLSDSLREAQETLDAIRSGEVDAVVVNGAKGNQIYSLAGAEHPYRVYVEQMQEGAVTLSEEGLILYCNQFFASMLGLPLERVIGSEVLKHTVPGAWDKISKVLTSAEAVVSHETVLRPLNGTELPIKLTASQLPLQDQKVICLVVTDLTEQRKHAELRLAKEVAEKANLAKDDFLAALSHELRTPLSPVLMATAALEQNTALPEDFREPLAMIRRNVELEARLIDDLLDLTRIARGKMELHAGEMDLHAVVHRVVEICQSDFNIKSQRVTLQLEAARHKAQGDSVRVQQALWNLVRNAAKFTGPNGSIAIRTRNPSPNRIQVEVTDTGIGFEPHTGDKLFQAFEQCGRHITRQFGGLGLGLAISRSIIEAHGGCISATSKGSGTGATFTFEIPLEAPSHIAREVTQPTGNGRHKFSQKRILLVEDHKDTRRSLEFLLVKCKHEVKSAASAAEALELAEANEFDLVISDIGLPDQSGLELMRQLKERYQLKGIGLSGYGMEEDLAKGREAGFLRYLTKPVRIDDLKEIVSAL